GIDPVRDLDQKVERLAVLRFLACARLAANRLLQHHFVLLQERVQGLQIAEEDSPLERSEPAALESRRAGEIDVKDGRRRRLEREAQALAPLVEMRCDPFELLRREIAGV